MGDNLEDLDWRIHRVQRSIRGDCYVKRGVSVPKRLICEHVSSFAFVVIKGPSLIKIISDGIKILSWFMKLWWK